MTRGTHTDEAHRQRSNGRRGVLACALVGIGVLAAACGGASPAPKVATLGTTTTTASEGSGRSPTGSNPLARLQAYAECIRSHGIHDFPDPTPNPAGQGGGFQISAGPGSDLDPNLPAFSAADKACKGLLPNETLTPAQAALVIAQGVKLAACMRAHGVLNWPDPDSQGTFDLNNIDPNSPQVQPALTTCQAQTGVQRMRVHATMRAGAGP